MVKKDTILLGVIVSVHGIRGEVKVKSFAQPADNIFKLPLEKNDGDQILLRQTKVQKDLFICKIKGVDDRNQAEQYIKAKLYTKRSLLPEEEEGEYYLYDLQNIKVLNQQGEEIGKVQAVHNFGAGDVVEVKFNQGEKKMLPFTKEIFPEITKDHIICIDTDIY